MSIEILQLVKAFFLGIVEGITEFLPISSTAHLILVGEWISFSSTQEKVFEVVIQFGSILAVMWIFRERLLRLILGTFRREPVELALTTNLIVAFLPAAVIGFLFIKAIKALFYHPSVIVVTLILGGLIMLWVERTRRPGASPMVVTADSLESITWKQALVIGMAQCLAMVPGTSRSASTIIGGMLVGVERRTATEFSFFLAMPTMLAAATYDLIKNASLLTQADTMAIVVGFVSAFISAMLVVKGLLAYLAAHTYRVFGWYRILLGIVVSVWLVTRG